MSSNFQQAREALGLRLRELRRDARLTGRDVAQRCGWHPTKVPKIEAGKQTPSDADLEAWATACDVLDQVPNLIASLRELEGQYLEYRRLFRQGGLQNKQAAFGDLEASAEFVRNFETCFIPGLLQTAEYARHRLAEHTRNQTDLAEAVDARIKRQRILRRPGRRFHIVITEAVLRLRLCPDDVLAGQLEWLIAMTSLRSVHLGVIPYSAQYPAAPMHGFWVFDERHVVVETIGAELNLTQPGEVRAYLTAFSAFADIAVYGEAARDLIATAAGGLTPTPD